MWVKLIDIVSHINKLIISQGIAVPGTDYIFTAIIEVQ